jgi:hypothetical protein
VAQVVLDHLAEHAQVLLRLAGVLDRVIGALVHDQDAPDVDRHEAEDRHDRQHLDQREAVLAHGVTDLHG